MNPRSMIVPDGLPTLSAGPHEPGSGRACVMEYVSLLAGEQWSDEPACTHKFLAWAAHGVNDYLWPLNRHLLVPMIGRLFGTDEDSPEIRAALNGYADPDYARAELDLWNDPVRGAWTQLAAEVTNYDDGIAWLTGLLDTYDVAAGRTCHRELAADDLAQLTSLVAA